MQYDMIAATGRWVGVDNYHALIADPIFWQAVGHTLELAVGTTAPLLALAVLFALVLNRRVRGRSVYRTILFAPYVIPLVASSIAWIWMFSSNGFVNEVLGLVLPVRGLTWLGLERVGAARHHSGDDLAVRGLLHRAGAERA